jgi:hypothetical protein
MYISQGSLRFAELVSLSRYSDFAIRCFDRVSILADNINSA